MERKTEKKSKYKKYIVLVVIALAIIGGGYWWWEGGSDAEEEQDFYSYMENEQERLIEAYKNDTYGGDTPEETWDMFVAALETGDVELASKYFIVEKQEEVARDFAIGKKSGGLGLFLDDFSRIESGDYFKNNTKRYRFVVIGTEGKWDGVVEFTYDLVLNEYTNIWKIESL